MRPAVLLTFAVLLMPSRAVAQGTAITPEMQAMEAKLLTRIGPQTRTWIGEQAERQGTSSTISEATTVRAATSFPYARLDNADVMALAFLVMMESARSAQEDVKATMDGVKAINAAKNYFVQSAGGSTVRSKEDLDCLDRIQDMESLRLQMAMDRRSKMMSTLSNILKKISDTASGITQNLK